MPRGTRGCVVCGGFRAICFRIRRFVVPRPPFSCVGPNEFFGTGVASCGGLCRREPRRVGGIRRSASFGFACGEPRASHGRNVVEEGCRTGVCDRDAPNRRPACGRPCFVRRGGTSRFPRVRRRGKPIRSKCGTYLRRSERCSPADFPGTRSGGYSAAVARRCNGRLPSSSYIY